MTQSAFYILFVVSAINVVQNFHVYSIPGLGEWIPFSSNSEKELVEVEKEEIPNEEKRKVVDASESNKDTSPDEPISVDDLLDQLSDDVKTSDDRRKREMAAVSQQLGEALSDNSIRKVNVLLKGIWHVVDLGLVGSSQRNRSTKKAKGMIAGFLSKIGKLFCGLFYKEQEAKKNGSSDENKIPESFDAREAWPECKDLTSLIRDQSNVGSCWAVSAASMLSDRLCIASKGTYKKLLSSEDLMRCCEECSTIKHGVVVGGEMVSTIDFMTNHGIVSGGEYGSGEGCMPYSYPPHNHAAFQIIGRQNAECEKKCSNEKYGTPYEKDKHYIENNEMYKLPRDTIALKKDLMAKGSCIVSMLEYDDFKERHEKGIYSYTHESNDKPNDHVIRLIGWGKENGIEYWLVANSRGKKWGDGGIAKINMVSGCRFGRYVWCVYPKVPT